MDIRKSGYAIEFIKNSGKIADEVLITSPNHFALATEILKELK